MSTVSNAPKADNKVQAQATATPTRADVVKAHVPFVVAFLVAQAQANRVPDKWSWDGKYGEKYPSLFGSIAKGSIEQDDKRLCRYAGADKADTAQRLFRGICAAWWDKKALERLGNEGLKAHASAIADAFVFANESAFSHGKATAQLTPAAMGA